MSKGLAQTTRTAKKRRDFLRAMLKSWYGEEKVKTAKLRSLCIDPLWQDYARIADSINPAAFGRYTLNPETQALKEERVFIPDFSAFVGKPIYEVVRYVMTMYGSTHHIPGIEYLEWLHENPGKGPTDGYMYFLPGSILCSPSGYWSVPCSGWSNPMPRQGVIWLGSEWSSVYRILLLEKKL